VVDSRLRIPITARVLSQQDRVKTIVVTTGAAPAFRLSALKRRGVESMICPAVRGRVSLSALLNELGRRGVTSLLLEGGSVLNGAMLRAKLVQRVRLYIAPVLLGGEDAKGLIGGTSPARLAQAVALRQGRIGSLGGDMVVEGDV
jgi:diaminohydroxyphosphoribosylaminopyrimidine deaminase/5-amino-6-(5-phosphoribosylamino)uracil reductase